MGAKVLRLLQTEYDINELQRQLDMCVGVTGKLQQIVKDYLLEVEVYNLSDINIADLLEYRRYINKMSDATDNQKKYYGNLLEQVIYASQIVDNELMQNQLDSVNMDRAIRNKTATFLMALGVRDAAEIDFEIREQYEKYLNETIAGSKISEYVKALDRLKLEAIKKENVDNPLKQPKLIYANEKLFLLYHPDYEKAMTFYYIREKEELIFDFSLAGSAIMKRQVFKMLSVVLDTKENWHDRRERFLVPLKFLYLFCIEKQIDDIEQLTEKQVSEFRESMDGNVGTKTDTYMQIVDNIRKYLFVTVKTTNWKANAWYLERFTFEDGRTNPAREIKRFLFGQIENHENRELFKEYMQYQLGVSQKSSLQTIRGQYYDINGFLEFLDDYGISVCSITAEQTELYIKSVDERNIQPEGFNRALISVARFLGYMVSKKKMQKVPLYFDYYFKNTFARHNDRMVSTDNQMQILKALKNIPLHLRLMYLNLWCIGLRVNEVCVIRGDAYYWDGKDAWFKIYQNKMKNEKYVPIPQKLYEIMEKYINDKNIKADEYVFKNKKGGAYDAGTFCKQFKKRLLQEGVEYSFKSHDFRHTVGTSLYTNGASIEVIRDYLGHKESDMTRKYLDFIPDVIDEENEVYFNNNRNKLVRSERKRKKHGK